MLKPGHSFKDMKTLKLAIFISGQGSNMNAIHEACKSPEYPAEISVVISNRPEAAGLKTAEAAGIPVETIDHKSYETREDFEDEIEDRLQSYDFDLIVLAGFMRVLTPSFVEKWPDQIINIHPSLLPDYKGVNTHKRAIEDGKTEGGCTVHFVSSDLDSGPVIAQKQVPILPEDTPETLAKRVLVQEHILYPKAIEILASSIV